MKIQKNLLIELVKCRLNILSAINPSRARKEIIRLFCTPQVRFNGKPAEVFLKSEPLELKLDGLTIRGFRCNHPSLQRVLILHGFSSSCHKFEHFVSPLVEQGYEVLAFDAPAHGNSDGEQVNALEYAAMIKKLHETYGPFTAYIGHSFGGLAACFALESMMPGTKKKLVLIAPAAETTTAIDNAFAMLKLKNKKLRQMMDDEILAVSGKETSWFSIRRAIKNIDAEILWIQDENDLITPMKDVLKVRDDNHSHVNFLVTKGLGHQKIYHDKNVIDTIVGFLGK